MHLRGQKHWRLRVLQFRRRRASQPISEQQHDDSREKLSTSDGDDCQTWRCEFADEEMATGHCICAMVYSQPWNVLLLVRTVWYAISCDTTVGVPPPWIGGCGMGRTGCSDDSELAKYKGNLHQLFKVSTVTRKSRVCTLSQHLRADNSDRGDAFFAP